MVVDYKFTGVIFSVIGKEKFREFHVVGWVANSVRFLLATSTGIP